MILVLSFRVQAVFANTFQSTDSLSSVESYSDIASEEVSIADHYALTLSKIYIEPYQRQALLLYPGVLENQRILHRHGGIWMRYEIQAHGDSEWFVLCDLATGKIIREQKLVDEVF